MKINLQYPCAQNNIALALLSFNHVEMTKKSVDSIIQYFVAHQINWPLLLIHNGSRAENVELLKKYFPNIQHLVIQDNAGFTGGVNGGLMYLFKQYDWVFFLTNDTTLIHFNLSVLDNLPPGLYAPTIYFRKYGRVDSMGGEFKPLIGKLNHLKMKVDKCHKHFYVPGTSFLIHRIVFNQVGTFDELLFTYWEDVDYSMRVKLHQFPLQHIEDIELIHAVGKTCHKDPKYTSYYFQRNRKIVSLRYLGFLGRIFFKCYFYVTMTKKLYYLIKKNESLKAEFLKRAILSIEKS